MVYNMPIMNKAVKLYKKTKKENQKAKLEQFNKEMGDKIKALQFSKPIKVDTNTIDEDFVALEPIPVGRNDTGKALIFQAFPKR
jgi:hypothetical protein